MDQLKEEAETLARDLGSLCGVYGESADKARVLRMKASKARHVADLMDRLAEREEMRVKNLA